MMKLKAKTKRNSRNNKNKMSRQVKRKNGELSKLKELFWDYNWESVVNNLSSPFVISRILEIGNSEQVKILIKHIGKETLKKYIEKYAEKHLSKLSYNFWKIYYERHLKKEEKKK